MTLTFDVETALNELTRGCLSAQDQERVQSITQAVINSPDYTKLIDSLLQQSGYSPIDPQALKLGRINMITGLIIGSLLRTSWDTQNTLNKMPLATEMRQ